MDGVMYLNSLIILTSLMPIIYRALESFNFIKADAVISPYLIAYSIIVFIFSSYLLSVGTINFFSFCIIFAIAVHLIIKRLNTTNDERINMIDEIGLSLLFGPLIYNSLPLSVVVALGFFIYLEFDGGKKWIGEFSGVLLAMGTLMMGLNGGELVGQLLILYGILSVLNLFPMNLFSKNKIEFEKRNLTNLVLLNSFILMIVCQMNIEAFSGFSFVHLIVLAMGVFIASLSLLTVLDGRDFIFKLNKLIFSFGAIALFAGEVYLAQAIWVFSLLITSSLVILVDVRFNREAEGQSYRWLACLSIFPLIPFPLSSSLFLYSAYVEVLKGFDSVLYILLNISLFIFIVSLLKMAYRFLNFEITEGARVPVSWSLFIPMLAPLVLVFFVLPGAFVGGENQYLYKWLGSDASGITMDIIEIVIVIFYTLVGYLIIHALYILGVGKEKRELFIYRCNGLYSALNRELTVKFGSSEDFVIIRCIRALMLIIIKLLDKFIFEFVIDVALATSTKVREIRPKGINSNLLFMTIGVCIVLIIFLGRI